MCVNDKSYIIVHICSWSLIEYNTYMIAKYSKLTALVLNICIKLQKHGYVYLSIRINIILSVLYIYKISCAGL